MPLSSLDPESAAPPAAPSDPLPLQRQALIDLQQRALAGALVYLPCWLGVAWLYRIHEAHPVGVAVVAALFFALGAGRFVLHRGFAQRVERNMAGTRAAVLVLLLGNALLLGLVAAATIVMPALQPTFALWSLITGVACAAGTMTLAIDQVVRFGFPAAVMLPVLAALLRTPSVEHWGIAVLVLMFFAYVLKTSRLVRDDYWRALRSSALLEERARQLERLAITDGLTQIANRMHFERRLADEWARAARQDQPVSVLVIDVDHFKRINDRHGHPFGDRCLIAAAAALSGALYREVDLVARYGGEEFAVLLPDTLEPAAAFVAERLRAAVQAIEIDDNGVPVALSCSIGVATMLPRVMLDKSAAAVALADAALYRAKAEGRNRVVVAPVPEWMQRAALAAPPASAPASGWRH